MMAKPSDIGGLFSARRIIVTGGNGAGKSVFADVLCDTRKLPLHRNDALVLMRDWRRRTDSDVARLRTEIAKEEAWVIEGGPSLLRHPSLADRATLVVWLDLPPFIRCWRILFRTWRYRGRTRPDLPDGNPEGFDERQWRFLSKAWKNHGRLIHAIEAAEVPCPILRLRSRKEVHSALLTLRKLSG